jgi:hypothetical protein
MAERERDGRGGAALAIAGAVGLVACVAYSLTFVNESTFPYVVAAAGLALALTIGGLLRRALGRNLPGSSERLRAIQDAPGPAWTGLARLFAFVVDFCAVCALAIAAYSLFRVLDYPPIRGCESWERLSRPAVAGMAFLRQHAACWGSRGTIDELGGFLATLGCGLWLLVPAAAWGATPGMLLIGRVWVRSDSHRVGAVHGAARALVGLVLAPLQALIALLMSLHFADHFRNVRTGERFSRATWGALGLLRRPRTVADACCVTEAIPR